MNFGPRSLAFRIVTFSTLWAVAALVVIATIISALYRDATEKGFDSLLSAHLFNLIGSVSVSEDGALQGRPELGELSFTRADSGWYWSVEPMTDGMSGELRSPSMTGPVAAPGVSETPFDAQFRRRYRTEGLGGEELDVLETEIVLDDQNRIARFRVMGNRSELETEIASFERRVYGYLALFGVGLILINAVAILLGLEPLDRVRSALAQVREGTAKKLVGRFPSEIEPLANETNALIENNRRIVERARTQVGNLAHSLKTPLAVMLNEGRAMGGERGRIFADQAGAMQQQLDHYLQRARVAAQRDSVVFRTPTAALLERMVRVIRKLKPDMEVTLHLPADEAVFAGEREDLEEMVGNLLENATKWGRRRIAVTVARDRGTAEAFTLAIEDDGPGIPDDKAREALKRGRRLDETKPGTGLGLAIVSDLVGEYGGAIALGRSSLGGLKAELRLPAAA